MQARRLVRRRNGRFVLLPEYLRATLTLWLLATLSARRRTLPCCESLAALCAVMPCHQVQLLIFKYVWQVTG